MESVRIRSYSDAFFPGFGLENSGYGHFLHAGDSRVHLNIPLKSQNTIGCSSQKDLSFYQHRCYDTSIVAVCSLYCENIRKCTPALSTPDTHLPYTPCMMKAFLLYEIKVNTMNSFNKTLNHY